MFWTIFRKELRVEWRSREVWYTGLFFAILLATVFMFGFQDGQASAKQIGPGVLWIALIFVSNLAFNRSFAREREAGCLAGLRLVPRIHTALFLGKWLSTVVLMVILEGMLVPMVGFVFKLPLLTIAPELALLLVLGTLGLCALGTVIGAALANIRLREILLPLVLFPLLVPIIAAGVRATSALVEGDLETVCQWGQLMIAFDIIYVVLSLWLFPHVIEAGE